MQRTMNKTAIPAQFAFCKEKIHSTSIDKYILIKECMQRDKIKFVPMKHTRNASAMKVKRCTAASLSATDVSSILTAQRTGL